MGSEIIVLVCISASILGITFRPFLSIILVFVLRILIRLSGALHLVPATASIWAEPAGMPRLFVQGAPTSNLFFSGRVALATIACCELMHLALGSSSSLKAGLRLALGGFGMVFLIGTVWVSLALRASW